MTLPLLAAATTNLIAGAAGLIHRYLRMRENRRAILYLEGMPDYLLNDIGLAPDADIRGVVEHGQTRQVAERGVSRQFGVLSHPV